MKEERSFVPEGSRYYFDRMLSPGKGWAQVDSSEDAWYYGTWANPTKLQIVTYAEGDVIIQIADNKNEFVTQMRKLATWHKEMEHTLFGIDPLCNEKLKDKFISIGLADLLH